MVFKVAFVRFYIVVGLSVDVDLDAAKVVVFQVERIATKRSVERLVVDQCDDDSARYLPRKQPLVNAISHPRPNAIALADDASDGIFRIPDLKRFRLFDEHGRRNMYFPHQQLAFMYLDFKPRVLIIRHQAKGSLRAYESKLNSDIGG